MVKICNIPDDDPLKRLQSGEKNESKDTQKPDSKISQDGCGIFSNTYVTRNQIGDEEIIPLFSSFDSNEDGKMDEEELKDLYNVYINAENIYEFENEEDKNDFLSCLNSFFNKVVDFIKNGDRTKVYINGEAINIDGIIDASEQGLIGDCWMLSQINALAGTDFGEKDINNSSKQNADGSYTVKIKKLHKKYKITPEEFQNAIDSGEYSSGDPDMILFELALEKHYDKLLARKDKKAIKQDQKTLSSQRNENGNKHSIDGGYGGNNLCVKKHDFDNKNVMNFISGADNYNIVSKHECKSVLDLKADNKNKLAIVFSSDYEIALNEETGETDIKQFESKDDAHEYFIKNVIKDDSGNITKIIIGDPHDSSIDVPVTYDQFVNSVTDLNIGVKDKELNKKMRKIDKKDYYAKILEDVNDLKADFSISKFQYKALNTYDTRLFIGYSGGVRNLYNNYMEHLTEYEYDMENAYKNNGIDGMNNHLKYTSFDTSDEEEVKRINEFMAKPMEERHQLNVKYFYQYLGFSDKEIDDIMVHPEKLEKYCQKYDYIY